MLADLQERCRILAEENERLASRTEDMLLLGLIAEEIDPAEEMAQVLERGLERISILKDIPYCACCRVDGSIATLESGYFQYADNERPGRTVELPCSIADALAKTDTIYLTGSECERIELVSLDGPTPFQARSALLIPVERRLSSTHAYVFADDRQDERLPGLTVMLHRAVDMIDSKIEILDLLKTQSDLNAQLKNSNRALAAATRAKSEFLAKMSHEIRTPLHSILGFAKLLKRDPNMTPTQVEQLEIINRSGTQLLGLINEVLDMSKIESGRVEVHYSPTDLHALLRDFELAVPARTEDRPVAFSVTPAPDLVPVVVTDSAKLRQILQNLLDNALKFTERGSIALSAASEPLDAQRIRLDFEVTDTGPGIEPEEMGVLFTKFAQTSTGRATGGGTGLGLAICREFARLLDGDVTVKSTPGVGTTFFVSITALVPPGD